MKELIANDEGNIGIRFDELTKTYQVFCNCILSEERAFKYGESCYRVKNYKYRGCAEKLFFMLISSSKNFIIKWQDKLFD